MLPATIRLAQSGRTHVAAILAIVLFPAIAIATDFNADFKYTACLQDFGGFALPIQGSTTATGPLIFSKTVPADDFQNRYEFSGDQHCSTRTLLSWALDAQNTTFSTPCIHQDEVMHIGFSCGLNDVITEPAYVYNGTGSCEFTQLLTLDPSSCVESGYDIKCPATRLPAPRLLDTPLPYHPLSTVAWFVHASGKSLTAINQQNSFPGTTCPAPAYVGDVAFLYYATRLRLSQLNADSLPDPLGTIRISSSATRGGPNSIRIACSDSATISTISNPPDGAHFVVVAATQDTTPFLDGPTASHVWIQDAVVRDGEHVIGTNAGPNGAIQPFGPVVLANGANQSFTIAPSGGYHIADVLVDGVSVGAVSTYTFTAVTADHRIDATFEADNSPPSCRNVHAVPAHLWPPDHRLVTVKLAGFEDADGDPVAAKITRVTQDEPSENGSHGPDAVIDLTGSCQLRAERDGGGNGRVYTLWYTATDGRGGECDGSVKVCVPHDRAHLDCIDDGAVAAPPHTVKEGQHPDRPFLGRTSISGRNAVVEYSIPTAGPVRLGLYDVAGRRVAVIEDGERTGGDHQVCWDSKHIASGIYFYRLRAGTETVVKAVMIR